MTKLWKSGDPYVWMTGGALGFCLLMVFGLVLLVMTSGLGFFWPAEVVHLSLESGQDVLGPVMAREPIPRQSEDDTGPVRYRLQLKRGNRDLYGSDFIWVNEDAIKERTVPAEALVIERREWGNFHGYFKGWRPTADAPLSQDRAALDRAMADTQNLLGEIRVIEREHIGLINREQEGIRLRLKTLTAQGLGSSPETAPLRERLVDLQRQYQGQLAGLKTLRDQMQGALELAAPGTAATITLPLHQVVRLYEPNRMTRFEKARFYAAKIWEFVSDDPRESNTEGGVFPALFGTVMMVMIMSLVVTPLGVLAALYLREYAKQGPLVSAVRIAVNNLAGVPSIVFGVFGVGFFIYFVGGGIDRLFYAESLPTPTFGTGGILWASLTLALMTVPVVIVATEEGLAAIPRGTREASLALGATKFETTFRVVLPAVMPAVLTGLILAMARAAGEVAPLMITGVVKLAPTLPLDGEFPFLHLDRKFMHLGFHIYDVGFQSPNVDAARPMVYTTTILLLLIVLLLNLTAILIRGHLRKKYQVSGL